MADQQENIIQKEDYGIDFNLLDCLILLNPEERITRHQRALELVRELQKAGQNLRG